MNGPRFIVALSAPAAEGLVRIPLAVTGKWVRAKTSFEITLDDLREVMANFAAKPNGEINVDYDHASEMPEVAAGGPVPSAGRITKLDEPESLSGKGQKVLYGWFEPTQRARELIQNREYRYISPAIDWSARNKQTGKPQGTTITSVALTNRPFLEEMPEIHLSDPAYQFVDTGDVHVDGALPNLSVAARQGTAIKEKTMELKPRKIDAGEHAGRIGCFDGDNLVGLIDEADMLACQGTKMADDARAELLTEIAGEGSTADAVKNTLAAAQREAAEKASRAALLSEAVKDGQFNAERATDLLSENKISPADFKAGIAAERRVNAAIAAGKLLPREAGEAFRLALSDVAAFKAFIEDRKAAFSVKPTGASRAESGDAAGDFKAMVDARIKEKNLTIAQALSEVSRENPVLAEQYRKAVSQGKNEQ